MRILCLSYLCLTMFTGQIHASAADRPVSFSRDILPILSDRCFHCHGPDASHREADLRLDVRDDAIRQRGDVFVIAPGRAADSELLRRISSSDEAELMPPADSHRKPLTPEEIRILTTWIDQGAVWGQHWAFETPVRAALPQTDVNPVDAFVLERLGHAGLQLSPPADASILLRRLSFDLTGLPPQAYDSLPAIAAGPESSASPVNAAPINLNPVLDHLFASPHYGERMAMWWLDAARYADTDGFQADATRTNWPWRDWVVEAFHRNMPFDQFTIEQFAGDLLPNATPDQILATCFHRNHMTNGEGGRDPEESRVDYVIDRTNTMGTVWLGLTLGCTQCHSHKFDPIAHDEYYQLSAFFNSIDEDGKAGGGAKPFLKYRSPLAGRAVDEATATVAELQEWHRNALQSATSRFEKWLPTQVDKIRNGFQAWTPIDIQEATSAEGTILSPGADGIISASGANPVQDDYHIHFRSPLSQITGLRLDVFPEDIPGGRVSRGRSGLFILTDVKLQLRKSGSAQRLDLEFDSAIASREREAKGRAYGLIRDTLDDDPRNGWMLDEQDAGQPQSAVFALKQPLSVHDAESLVFTMLQRSTDGDANIARFRISLTDQPGMAVRSLQPMPMEQLASARVTSPEGISEDLRSQLQQQFLSTDSNYQKAALRLKRAEQQLADCKRAAGDLNVMVLAERSDPRATFVLDRGVWDAHGEQVRPGFPAVLMPSALAQPSLISQQTSAEPLSRLDLAHWIVSRDNPLTARVCVNHLWQMLFGYGLVRTPEDFGLQGDRPEHPELLDWLAVELMDHNWDLQHLLRVIVNSRTYQQSSHVTAELLERDPENRLLMRQTRFRLPSWMIRDAALAWSQLLNPALGGPPVMPYQPPGVWEEMFMGRFTYQPSIGAAQYRRTLYAFWRRSSAPTFLFDSAQRRVCEVGRRHTNTPLQALTLLNDQTFLEAAHRLANDALQHGSTPQQQIDWMGQRILSRSLRETEITELMRHFLQATTMFETRPDQVSELLSAVQTGPEQIAIDVEGSTAMHGAALLTVAGILLNLDESISRE